MNNKSKEKQKFFNYPIVLHKDFLSDSKTVLNDILYYALYNHSRGLEYGNEIEAFTSACNFYEVTFGSIGTAFKRGKFLFNSIDTKSSKAGIETKIFWDFYNNDHRKSDFSKVCLLGFLSIKSILGKDAVYWKLSNEFWFSRMAGYEKTTDADKWPKELLKFYNDYQARKIKSELIKNWHLVTYSRYTRGFYVSFKLSLEKLIFEAEEKRKSNWEKQYKETEKDLVKKVLGRLNNSQPIDKHLITF